MSDSAQKHRIIFGDSQYMSELADASVHLVVTSPPYWCIKDYEHPGQIGHRQAYDEYLASMERVIAECHRVLHPGCRMAINIGDQYLRASEHGRYRVQPIPADLSVIGRQVGFDFMGNIIWRKVSTTNTTGGCTLMGSMYYPRDGHVTYEHEYILLLRKRGDWPGPASDEAKEKSRLTKEQRSRWFRGVWDDIPPARQEDHVAMFPLEIPRRLIKMYTFWADTVLDPFMGSGTTALAAHEEGRSSVGYEINEAFREVIRDKFGVGDASLFDAGEVDLTFETREAPRDGDVTAQAAVSQP
ncbi:MAG: site-specific DNA-methyltransferase [Armatimonadota bacterium]|nr:site-specific DNA-methyltransferase [Armatimonadota bacterium]